MIVRACVIFLLLTSSKLFGQAPVADFTISDSAGCAPFVVSFTSTSTGNPTFWNWDFGNGQLSSLENPVTTYSAPGTYSVQLVVRNADGTNGITKTDIITVYPSPLASFSADRRNSCLPGSIQFTDLSSDPGGTIASWEWNFGDTTTSNVQNPLHTYNNVGFYGVSLKVTSTSGCTSTSSQGRFIRILSGVEAEFSNSPPTTCQPPFSVQFQNQTSGPGTLTYEWDLGSGETSTAISPTATFNTPGDYFIKLKATSDFGCSDTISKTISVRGTSTGFTGPDTICVNSSAVFQDTSAPTPTTVIWDIGGQQFSGSSANPTFTTAGTFPVKMFAAYPTCRDSSIKQIVVRPEPIINFSASKSVFCKLPAVVNFTDNTPNAVSWQWDFGDGNVSNVKDPQHSYSDTGTYNVRLVITDRFGCTDTLQKPGFISINYPVATITNLNAGGCIPFAFTPTTNVQSNDPVATYKWDFGNGVTSVSPTPSVTYVDSGTYSVSLIVTTVSGCTDTAFYPNSVRTGTIPPVDFSFTYAGACANAGVAFQSIVTPATTGFLWDFGDNTTSTEPNVTHVYTDTGFVSVSLTVTRNGCPNTILKTNVIRIPPPIANFTVDFDCVNTNQAIFKDSSILSTGNGPITYQWQFGDPANTTSTLPNPTFNYSTPGTYKVTLTVADDSCSSTITKDVIYYVKNASFTTANPKVCRNTSFTLTADSANSPAIASYNWKIGTNVYTGGPSIQPALTANGVYDVTLTITDIYGCSLSNTVSSYLTVGGPNALFDLAAPVTCLPAITTFNDKSTSTEGIKEYLFDFGDSTVERFTAAPFTHQYADTGLYNVKLTVTDVADCSAAYTLPVPVRIAGVNANFGNALTVFCPGFPVTFTDSSSGTNLTYSWNFGDGGTSTDKNPVHTFAAAGVYTISLTASDMYGCSDSIVRTDYITIRRPAADFTVSDSVSLCPPFEVNFAITGTDFVSHSWDFGDGQPGNGTAIRHFYNDYGNYTAKLYLYGNGGCVDSTMKQIQVILPSDIPLTYSPLDSCNQITVDFDITAPPSTRYVFLFGDGKIDSTQQASFQHFYDQPGLYFPVATFTDKVGCIVNRAGGIPIRVRGAQPFFGVDKTSFCDSGTVTFTNFTIGNDPVVSYLWDFDDNTTSANKDVVHTFTSPGTYIVSLTVNTASGCSDIVYDTINVYSTPVTTISSPDTICVNALTSFNAMLNQADTTGILYSWNFGDGSGSTQRNTSHTYTTPGDYNVILDTKVAFGCASTTTKTVHVVQLPTITFANDPVLASGRSIDIPVTYTGPIVTYNWTPSGTLSCATCPVPKATPEKTTKYEVTVVDSFGCTVKNAVTIMVVCGDKNLFLPNTFSPNGDGSNERFYPRGGGLFQVKYLRIFNRWGEQIFEKMNFAGNQSSEGWDGTYKGKPAPADVYVYIIEIVCSNSESFQYKGNIMLLR